MREWYHYAFQVAFGILVIQNALIFLSILTEGLSLTLPYYFDIVGFSILLGMSFYYAIQSRNKYAVLAALSLTIWMVARVFLQFIIIPSTEFDSSLSDDALLSSIGETMTTVSILLFVSGLGLLLFGLFLQFASETNLSLLLLYVFTNMLAILMISFSFLLQSSQPIEEQLSSSTLGFVFKLILVPILGIFAFGSLLMDTEKIYPVITNQTSA